MQSGKKRGSRVATFRLRVSETENRRKATKIALMIIWQRSQRVRAVTFNVPMFQYSDSHTDAHEGRIHEEEESLCAREGEWTPCRID